MEIIYIYIYIYPPKTVKRVLAFAHGSEHQQNLFPEGEELKLWLHKK